MNSKRQVKGKLGTLRGTNSRLPFDVNVKLNLSIKCSHSVEQYEMLTIGSHRSPREMKPPHPPLPLPLLPSPLSEFAPHSTVWTSGTGTLSTTTKSDERWLYSQSTSNAKQKAFGSKNAQHIVWFITLEILNLAHVVTMFIVIIIFLARGNSGCWGLELLLCAWPYTVNRMVRCP